MTKRLTFLCALLLFLSTSANAENLNDLLRNFRDANRQGMKQHSNQECIIALPGPGFHVNGGKYVLTKEAFDINTDVVSAIKAVLGNDASIADWQTLKRMFSTRT